MFLMWILALELPADTTQDLMFRVHQVISSLLDPFGEGHIHDLPYNQLERGYEGIQTDLGWIVLEANHKQALKGIVGQLG